jgi:hypothetical protein
MGTMAEDKTIIEMPSSAVGGRYGSPRTPMSAQADAEL